MPYSRLKENAEAAAIAGALIVVAVQLVTKVFTLREFVALLIAAPSSVMLFYNLVYPDPDRIYNIGLFSTLLVIAGIIYGLPSSLLLGILVGLVALLILVSRPRAPRGESGKRGS